MIGDDSAPDPRLLSRVELRNYKSIWACDVELHPLTLLVGPNGSGKSNFIDALRFVAESLNDTLELAVRRRGGIDAIRRPDRPSAGSGIRLDAILPDGSTATYAFELRARPFGGFVIDREVCRVLAAGENRPTASFTVEDGKVRGSVATFPPLTTDRLYLVNAGGLPEFAPVYEALSRMAFYRPNPDAMRQHQPPDPGERLAADGSNVASVLSRLMRQAPEQVTLVEEYLQLVLPGLKHIEPRAVGSQATVEFVQLAGDAPAPLRFESAAMSDGTLRALAILVALFQSVGPRSPRLIGIEEPETGLHPAAGGILRSAFRQASYQSQILVTSHNPELLDDPSMDADELLAVQWHRGATRIGPIDEAGRSVMADHLFTAGELLALDQLQPRADDAAEAMAPHD